MQFPIYLDHHATTPLDRRVLDHMMPYLTDDFGNASSLDHKFGHDASLAVESSRKSIANLIGSRPTEIVFTSGATESDNLAIIGTMNQYKDRGNHMITCVTEHKAVLATAEYIETQEKSVTYLSVDKKGRINLKELEDTITDSTVLISIMAANNEIGTIADIEEIGKIAHKRNIIFHTDAAQAIGRIPIDVVKMNIDLMSISAHKMYGPKGVGALYVRGINPRIKPSPILHGGGQERDIRSGTLNIPGIVGFGKAADIASKEMLKEQKQFILWSDIMLTEFEKVGGALNGSKKDRLAHNLSICFPGIESKAIINSVSKKLAISSGSACTTQTVEPSHVLLAIGLNENDAHSSIRIGLGRFNTLEEIKKSSKIITDAVKNIDNI
ncbi:MAG: aminotransferase class V [Cenarchaeum symbiont of Oopsacas minuta]|nr:aminotransferase class V [Cenarchaeum symbiont of Oopsacas minuta]